MAVAAAGPALRLVGALLLALAAAGLAAGPAPPPAASALRPLLPLEDVPAGLRTLLERPCRVYGKIFTANDYTEELAAMAFHLLQVRCRMGGKITGPVVADPCGLLRRFHLEDVEETMSRAELIGVVKVRHQLQAPRVRGAALPWMPRLPRRPWLTFTKDLCHEACQYKAFEASVEHSRDSSEGTLLVRQAVTAMGQLQQDGGMHHRSVEPEDDGGYYRRAADGAAEAANATADAAAGEGQRAQQVFPGEYADVPLAESFAPALPRDPNLPAAALLQIVQRVERAALEALYRDLDGRRWRRNDGWAAGVGSGGAYCRWHGITCATAEAGVLEVALPANGLQGPVSPQLGSLLHLQHLDLSHNALKGKLPPEVGRLKYLQSLNLRRNFLGGRPPDGLQDLERLKAFDVSANGLAGRLPVLLKSPGLRLFNASLNPLETTLPRWLGRASNLEALSLSRARVAGDIPEEYTALARLRLLDLADNRLNGTLPAGLRKLRNLEVLDVSGNALAGAIPPLVQEDTAESLDRLVVLSLARNRLEGSLPDWLPPKLMALDAAENALTALVPEAFLYLERLRHLNLSRNAIAAEFVGGQNNVKRLQALESLDVSHNAFRGGLPRDLAALSRLRVLKARGNGLTGELPERLSRLGLLRALDLADNRLEGGVPDDLADLHQLTLLDLSGNAFSGRVPLKVLALETLEHLDVSGNNITWAP